MCYEGCKFDAIKIC
ncbi:MAG: hypothetical protein R2875_15650 [Desulfobacterales bacterium]